MALPRCLVKTMHIRPGSSSLLAEKSSTDQTDTSIVIVRATTPIKRHLDPELGLVSHAVESPGRRQVD